MKKKFVCLMIAGLSLFATPYHLTAGTLPTVTTEETAPPVKITPEQEKKINAFKLKHPKLFGKQENKASENTTETTANRDGGAIYISGVLLILIIILLIILL